MCYTSLSVTHSDSIVITSGLEKVPLPKILGIFCNIIFYGKELIAPRPTTKLEDHTLSAVRNCLFNILAATIHIWRPFLHTQPEYAACRDDRDPLITVVVCCECGDEPSGSIK